MLSRIICMVLAAFAVVGMVSADIESGGTVIDDSVVFDSIYATLRVTPHTAYSPAGNFRQVFKVDSKNYDGDLCMAYVFDEPLQSGSIALEKNMSYYKVISDYGDIEKKYLVENILSINTTTLPCDLGSGTNAIKRYVTQINGSLVYCFNSYDEIDNETYEITYNDYGYIGYHLEQDYRMQFDDVSSYFSKYSLYEKSIYTHLTPLHFSSYDTNRWEIEYVPNDIGSGKYDLWIWNSINDNCIYDMLNDNYNFLYKLDPWWNGSFGFRYLMNNTDGYAYVANGSSGVVGNWIHYLAGGDDYLYSSDVGPDGKMAIANDSSERPWFNSSKCEGNNQGYVYPGALAVLTFDENSGNVLRDCSDKVNNATCRSGNESYGTQVPCNFSSGRFGYAIENGNRSAQYAILPSIATGLNESFTAEIWVYPTATSNHYDNIIGRSDEPATHVWSLWAGTATYPDNWTFYWGTGPVTLRGLDHAINQWFHLAAVYNGTHIALYVNGSLQAGWTPVASGVSPQTTNITIGRGKTNLYDSDWGTFTGKLDEFRYYNRTLSADEIMEHYQIGINNVSMLSDIINSAPSVNISYTNNTYTNDSTPDITFIISDDNATYDLSCELYIDETQGYGVNASIINGTLTTLSVNTTLADGNHTVKINCSDGLLSGVSDTINFTVDTTHPGIIFSSGTESNNSYKSQNYVYINVSVTEINFNNITFRIGNSTSVLNETNITTSTYSWTFSDLNPNEYYFYNVTVRDVVGYENTTETRKITLDGASPTVNLTSPSNGSASLTTSVIFQYTPYDMNALMNCSLYSNVTGPFSLRKTESTITNNGSNSITNAIDTYTDGSKFSWNIYCCDYAGNCDYSVNNYTFTVLVPTTTTIPSSGGGGSSSDSTSGETGNLTAIPTRIYEFFILPIFDEWEYSVKMNHIAQRCDIDPPFSCEIDKSIVDIKFDINASSEVYYLHSGELIVLDYNKNYAYVPVNLQIMNLRGTSINGFNTGIEFWLIIVFGIILLWRLLTIGHNSNLPQSFKFFTE